MSKGLEALESLDKLEECAYAMKDLPMSNWIDLANSEAELDLKIMNWVETIKLELFKGKQDLDRLEKLEKENQELKRKYESQDFLYQNEVSKNGALVGNIFEKDLKIQKLEKAIEILKDKFNFELDKPIPNGVYPLVYENRESGVPRLAKGLSQQEYEILKEVLEE